MSVSVGNITPVSNAMNGSLPCEGAKFLQYLVDFSAAQEYDFDFTQQFQQGQFTTIQTIFINNVGNAQAVTVDVNGGQEFTCPAGKQGYFAMLMIEPPSCKLISTGGVVVNVQFMNFYIPPIVW